MYEFDEIGLKFKNRQSSRNCHNNILDNNYYNDDYSILSMMITYMMSLLRNKTYKVVTMTTKIYYYY